MSDSVMSFVSSPVVVIVAKIVSPGCVSLCWNVISGLAETKDMNNSPVNKKNTLSPFIIL